MDALILLLKLTGSLLLFLLCFVLLAAVLLLILPIRSRVSGSVQDGTAEGTLRVSWLLRFLSAEVRLLREGRLQGSARLLGFRILNLDWSSETAGKETGTEETVKQEAEKPASEETAKQEAAEPGAEKNAKQEAAEPAAEKNAKQEAEKPAIEETAKLEAVKPAAEETAKQEAAEPEGGRTLRIAKRLFSFGKKLLHEEKYREVSGRVLRSIQRILRELLPRKGSGELVFGTGDGIETCQVLEGLTLLWPASGGWLEITPLLEERTLEASFRAKGRLTLAVLLAEAVRLWRDREFRQILTEWNEE